MSESVWPHRWQPTRLLHPLDSPGKNTGVGCHFLLQCMKVKVKVKSLSHVRLFTTPQTAAYQAPNMSSNFQMFVQVQWKFITFLVQYLLPLKIEEYQRKRWIETEQDSIILASPPPMSSACLLPVKNFSQRISLIREVRNAETKENSLRRLNNTM